MRKQVIKFFALDYKVFIFGRLVGWTRSANIIFPLMLLCGTLTISESPLAHRLTPFALSALFVALFFGFLYFKIKPLKEADYDYLDDIQKWQYNAYHKGATQELQHYNSRWALLVNPLAIVLFLIWYLCN